MHDCASVIVSHGGGCRWRERSKSREGEGREEGRGVRREWEGREEGGGDGEGEGGA